MGQGLQGTLAWWVEKERVRSVVHGGVAEHFREHWWATGEGTGPEVGFLGRGDNP